MVLNPIALLSLNFFAVSEKSVCLELRHRTFFLITERTLIGYCVTPTYAHQMAAADFERKMYTIGKDLCTNKLL